MKRLGRIAAMSALAWAVTPLCAFASSSVELRAMRSHLKPSQTAQPPCAIQPSLEFLADTAPGTNLEHVASAAWFARAVQLNTEQRSLAWGLLPVKPKKIQDIYAGPFGLHATILEFEDSVLVMYRGTQDPLDYLLNALIYTTPGFFHRLPGWVHKGFLANFSMTWRQVHRTLDRLTDRTKPIFFAAHSLGGAMSQYAAWRLEQDGFNIGRIYAFQSPNAGDIKFKHSFDQKFQGRAFNTLYGDDVTPFIPPTRDALDSFTRATVKPLSGTLHLIAKKANYASLNGRMVVDANGSLETESEHTDDVFWRTYKDKTNGRGFPLGLSATSGFVADHNIDRVLCSLAKGL